MNLTEEQHKAITLEKNVSVIASAGTGKTTVLTQRFINTYKKRHTPLYNILAFTFTEKASREMKERILKDDSISLDMSPALNISTIHSFCHNVLINFGSILGLSQDFTLFDEQSYSLWKELKLNDWIESKIKKNDKTFIKFTKFYGMRNLKSITRQLLNKNLVTLPKEELICLNQDTELEKDHIEKFLNKQLSFQSSLLKERIEGNILSYDDLETLTIKLFNENPSILSRLQDRYKHILVDEYQDVSPAQFKIIKDLFNPEKNEIFIVGDPKQSIYGFRNADVHLFEEMKQSIENHGGETIYLTETFRTPASLLNYFNEVFSKIFTDGLYQRATTSKTEAQATLYKAPLPESRLSASELHANHAHQISSMINNLIENGVNKQEIAIILYARGPIKIYEKALQDNNIAYITETKKSLLELPLLNTVWHILCYISGDKSKITQTGILKNPFIQLSENLIDQIRINDNVFSDHTLDLFLSQRDKNNFCKLITGLDKWQSLSQSLNASEVCEIIAHDLAPKITIEESWYLSKFLETLKTFNNLNQSDLSQLKNSLLLIDTLQTPIESAKKHPNGVQLLTIHGAKGLEFEHVFLVPGKHRPNDGPIFLFKEKQGFHFKTHDCEVETTLKYKLDDTNSMLEIKENLKEESLNELKRLVYVALTRTKKSLYLFPDIPSQKLKKSLASDINNLTEIKNYNQWLYWLSENVQFEKPPALNSGEKQPVSTELVFQDILVEPLRIHKPILTVTEMETFSHCQKRFQLKYAMNVKAVKKTGDYLFNQPPKTKLSSRERGNLFHEILQYYKGDNLNEVIEQALFDQHITSQDDIRKECEDFIRKLENNPKIQPVLFSVHESFEEIEFSLELKEFILSGQIDKVIRYENENGTYSLMVVDYKTHSSRSEEEYRMLAQSFQFQMSCYALALRQKFKVSSVESMILFTNGPTHHKRLFSSEDLDNFKNSLNILGEDLLSRIRENQFNFTDDSNYCKKCGYFKEELCGITQT